MTRTAPLLLFMIGALAHPEPAVAQAPPGTDIWIAPLALRAGRLSLGAPVNVTARPGYDNQPAFLPDGSGMLYTRIGGDGQADVWRYDFATHSARAIITTPESEYSPTPIPGGVGISVVRVERDSTQRLWRFDTDGTNPALLLDRLKPVGYHAWAGDRALVLFVLGDTNALVVAIAATGRVDTVARNVGRSPQTVPGSGRRVSFVQRVDSTESWLAEVDAETRTVQRLVRLPRGVDFHAWTPGGLVLASDGATLLQWDPRAGGPWVPIADLGALGLHGVTRLAVSPRGDRLALVAADPAP
jgi:WD40 repeat protein